MDIDFQIYKIVFIVFSEEVYYKNSVKLDNLPGAKDNFILIDGVGHNDILENEVYKKAVKDILAGQTFCR